jgi:hypothetical protein
MLAIFPSQSKHILEGGASGGCKHGKVDQNSAPVYQNHVLLVKDLKVVAKACLEWDIFFMMTSIVVSNTQL